LKLSFEQDRSGQLRARLEGILNMETVPDGRRQLLRIARRVKTPVLEVDFSGISAMDTSAVALMVEVLQTLSQSGRKLRLTGLRDDQKRFFHLARLNDAFGIKSDSREGV
jgi:anti-anti-sigma factor